MNGMDMDDVYGFLTGGTSGSWSVSIDENSSRDQDWLGEIDGPSVYISFQLRHINVLSEVVRFLGQDQSNTHNDPIITLGRFDQNLVSLVWDNEDFNRCFLTVGDVGKNCLRFTLLEDDILMLREAFSLADAEVVDTASVLEPVV